MKNIFVCAGMSTAKNDNINNQAYELGIILAKAGYTYSQGGSAQGLMGLTLKGFLEYSNKVKFYIPEKYYACDIQELKPLFNNPEQMDITITNGEAERLKSIIQSDEIIILPGGTGTLEELLYCNETARAKEHQTKINLINIDGYYDGFLAQVESNKNQGFTKPTAINYKVYNSIFEIETIKNIKNNLN